MIPKKHALAKAGVDAGFRKRPAHESIRAFTPVFERVKKSIHPIITHRKRLCSGRRAPTRGAPTRHFFVGASLVAALLRLCSEFPSQAPWRAMERSAMRERRSG